MIEGATVATDSVALILVLSSSNWRRFSASIAARLAMVCGSQAHTPRGRRLKIKKRNGHKLV